MSNYTKAMEQRIRDAAPLNLAKAKALAEEFASVSHRSVISKAQSLGVEYVKAAPAARVSRGPTRLTFSRRFAALWRCLPARVISPRQSFLPSLRTSADVLAVDRLVRRGGYGPRSVRYRYRRGQARGHRWAGIINHTSAGHSGVESGILKSGWHYWILLCTLFLT